MAFRDASDAAGHFETLPTPQEYFETLPMLQEYFETLPTLQEYFETLPTQQWHFEMRRNHRTWRLLRDVAAMRNVGL